MLTLTQPSTTATAEPHQVTVVHSNGADNVRNWVAATLEDLEVLWLTGNANDVPCGCTWLNPNELGDTLGTLDDVTIGTHTAIVIDTVNGVIDHSVVCAAVIAGHHAASTVRIVD